ncbi:unnamed protein product [Citrullus colocynthis]|uniref:Uncharacterized protein n=1 Tax=Citrullus colocynthis TaxID=252529 RepID=A0ABP0YGA5_9ROSI
MVFKNPSGEEGYPDAIKGVERRCCCPNLSCPIAATYLLSLYPLSELSATEFCSPRFWRGAEASCTRGRA